MARRRGRGDRSYILKTPEQRHAVSSPVRLEMLEHFRTEGGVSVREVAARMGRTPGSLYYHVRLLEEAGILVDAGSRPRGKRSERLYRLIAPVLMFPSDERIGKKKARIGPEAATAAASILRLTQREFDAALESEALQVSGRGRNFYMRRAAGRLSREALAEVNRHLEAIEKIVNTEVRQAPVEGGAPCSLLITLLPLARRTGAEQED